MEKEILAYISTRGRTESTLPMAMQAIAMQTKKLDKLIIFDDNDTPMNLETPQYKSLFKLLSWKGISGEIIKGECKGQHFNHQKANKMGYTWCWRVDDDCIPEHDVLEKLYAQTNEKVGAVGGSIITLPIPSGEYGGKISDLYKNNKQWDYIKSTEEVEHLHCSFLYRSGVTDYDLALSKVAHREETLFTYNIFRKGYKILITPCVTWHLKEEKGGIRDGIKELYEQDERIFQYKKDNIIAVLDCGIGDHIVFKKILPELKKKGNVLLAVCYPDVFPEETCASIHQAQQTIGDLKQYNIYEWMAARNWEGSLEDAFRGMYL